MFKGPGKMKGMKRREVARPEKIPPSREEISPQQRVWGGKKYPPQQRVWGEVIRKANEDPPGAEGKGGGLMSVTNRIDKCKKCKYKIYPLAGFFLSKYHIQCVCRV